MSETKRDPGFVADVMASDDESAKRVLRLMGAVEMSEVCEHDWHCSGTVNGRREFACQKCGKVKHD